eukprot:jgi/Galph1/4347/GphlegSOOS_G2946.1
MESNLQTLFYCCKDDFEAYRTDVECQLNLLDSLLQLTLEESTGNVQQLGALLIFASQLARYINKLPITAKICKQILELLEQEGQVLDALLRFQLIRTLSAFRKSKVVDCLTSLPCYFKLFQCSDKQLRKYLFHLIMKDVEYTMELEKDAKLHNNCKALLYQFLQDSDDRIVQKTLQILVRLYGKGILSDATTCNVLSSCCFHENAKVKATAVHFYLQENFTEEKESDSSSDEEENEEDEVSKIDPHVNQHAKELWDTFCKTGKKNVRKKKQTKRKISRMFQSERRMKRKYKCASKIDPPITLLFSPQEFAERLFSELKKRNQGFRLRLSIINLISRVIGYHQLDIPSFVNYLLKYIRPHQAGVTNMLVILLQSIHEYTPLETVEMVLRYLAQQFVVPHVSADTCAVGLNTIRIICTKQAMAMNSELLEDLIAYKTSKDRGVMMAARSLLSFYRNVHPELLPKSERGKEATMMLLKKKKAALNELTESEEASGQDETESLCFEEEEGSCCDEANSEESSKEEETEIELVESEQQEEEHDNTVETMFSCSRILTDADFASSNKTREERERSDKHVVTAADIESFQVKRRKTKEERLARVKEGRKDRGPYGKQKKQKFKSGPTTNRAKQRLQSTVLLKQKKKRKWFQSFKQRNKNKK